MILSIVPEVTDAILRDCPPSTKVISYKTFNDLSIHPFIATHSWDSIEVVIGKGMLGGYLKQVLTKCNVINAHIPKDLVLDYEAVSRLIEIYPTVAAELRSTFMAKEDMIPILKKVGVVFDG